ncbi:MAG: Txe/YoeB family addiction module toxin [Oscillospiraceae bacterium]|nr:Txe/YoeB family addiction module toxin [Oscillospiraceae bacterium]
MWEIRYASLAAKDIAKLKAAKLDTQALRLIGVLRTNPFQNPPPYEKLKGHHPARYSRRINRQHRLVYEIDIELKHIKILRMWTHYERG